MPAKDGDTFTFLVPATGPAVAQGKRSSTTLNARQFRVETVVSPAALERGLSGRPPLPTGHGMLFIFPRLDRHTMWMPEMRFPLDIVWLDENLGVVHITRGAQPCPNRRECPSYGSEKMAKYAIEMTAGEAAAYGFRIGTQLSLL